MNIQKTYVALVDYEDYEVFEALVDLDVDWNGAACPRFTREEGLRLMKWLNDVAIGEDMRLKYDEAADVFIEDDFSAREADEVTTYGRDADGLYPIGAFGWTWTVAPPGRNTCFFCGAHWGECTCPEMPEDDAFDWEGTLITQPHLSANTTEFVDPRVYYGDAYRKREQEIRAFMLWRVPFTRPASDEVAADAIIREWIRYMKANPRQLKGRTITDWLTDATKDSAVMHDNCDANMVFLEVLKTLGFVSGAMLDDLNEEEQQREFTVWNRIVGENGTIGNLEHAAERALAALK